METLGSRSMKKTLASYFWSVVILLYHGSTTTPGSTTYVPGSTTNMPGSTPTVPGSTSNVPGNTAIPPPPPRPLLAAVALTHRETCHVRDTTRSLRGLCIDSKM